MKRLEVWALKCNAQHAGKWAVEEVLAAVAVARCSFRRTDEAATREHEKCARAMARVAAHLAIRALEGEAKTA